MTILARPHENRTKREVQLVDKRGPQILPDRCDTATDSYILVLCRLFRTLQGGMNPVGDEVKRSPAFHLHRLTRVMC